MRICQCSVLNMLRTNLGPLRTVPLALVSNFLGRRAALFVYRSFCRNLSILVLSPSSKRNDIHISEVAKARDLTKEKQNCRKQCARKGG